ncbi:MAG: methyltransferase domain-containing protein [Verrucomicrobiota bacterium]
MTLLNLACGSRYHPDWKNIDLYPQNEHTLVHDLSQPLPFPDHSVDACYSAHFLGHLPDAFAMSCLKDQARVLKPGGIIRIACPDLQQIIDQYQELIGPLAAGDLSRAADYEWNQIELYDQVNRSHYGGKMLQYLSQKNIPNRDYILRRNGEECAEMMDQSNVDHVVSSKKTHSPLSEKIAKARRKLAGLLVQIIAGSDAAQAYKTGLFRRFSGEVQHRVYDQYSLTRDLTAAGFADVRKCSATESRIPDFASFHFDTNEQGVERKPESLYLEATIAS